MRVPAALAVTLLATFSWACGPEDSATPTQRAEQQTNPLETAAWWVEQLGVLPADDPLALRAHDVFGRVEAAAERRSARQPQLFLLAGEGSPFAMALRDGSILLTRGAITLCYRERSVEDGDARLAFVLGHELAHLSENHFEHQLAFSAAADAGVGRTRGSETSALGRFLRTRASLDATNELAADTAGLLTMTFAGYEPWVLLGEKTFFAEWVDQAGPRTGGSFADGGHPSPEERAAYLVAQLSDVAVQIPLFHFGTRLVQAGRLADGVLLLERFAERFPSREVLSNIGVAQARIALRALGRCDGALVSRLRLPLLLDQRTLAERTIRRGASSPCYEREDFRRASVRAIQRLEAAVERDPAYAPATLNLVATYVLFDQPARALELAREAVERFPTDLDVQTAAAVSLYAYGESSGLESADRALAQLEAVLQHDPRHPVALYDRAAILGERDRTAAAEEAWRRFLSVEPAGTWAATARAWLGESSEPVKSMLHDPAALETEPRLGAGPVAAAILEQGRHQSFSIGDLEIETIRGPLVSLLRLGKSTELIESTETFGRTEAMARFGEPLDVEPTPRGSLWLYPGFALDFDGSKTTWIRFARPATAPSDESC